jgi:hypothetical protein
MALPSDNTRHERGLSVRVGRFEEDLRGLMAVVLALSSPPTPWPHTLTLTDHAARSSGPLQQEAARRTAGQIQDVRRGFERFVDVLPTGQEGLGGGGGGGFASSLQCLNFVGVHFGPDGGFRHEDVARQFGEVVPALLPTLERLRFRSCFLPTNPLVALLQRMSGSQRARESTATATTTTARILSLLEIADCSVHTDVIVPYVVELIRSNAPIEFLMFLPNESLGRGACRQLFDSLPHNRHLRRLSVCVERVFDGALVLPSDLAALSSSLRQLHLKVDHWDRKGKACLARQLQTNTALTNVRVVYLGNTALSHRPWIDMLERHNFTLLSLTEESILGPWGDGPMRSPKVAALLQRNGRIRQALEQLSEYRVAHMARVPHILEMVNTLPTLLYRFLRRGDVNALVDHLHLPVAARQQRQEGSTSKRIRTA